MQNISKKNIWLIASFVILWIVFELIAQYFHSKYSQDLITLTPEDLRKAVWFGIIYSLCGVPAFLVLNIPLKKMLAKPGASKLRIWGLLLAGCITSSCLFPLSGQTLMLYGLPYWQYVCFAAAGLVGVLVWGFWETRVFARKAN